MVRKKNGWLEVLHFATQQRMKKKTKPSKKSPYTVLHQICNLIPPLLVPNLAREYGVDAKSRTFSPWNHVVSLMYAHLSHAFGLNDV